MFLQTGLTHSVGAITNCLSILWWCASQSCWILRVETSMVIKFNRRLSHVTWPVWSCKSAYRTVLIYAMGLRVGCRTHHSSWTICSHDDINVIGHWNLAYRARIARKCYREMACHFVSQNKETNCVWVELACVPFVLTAQNRNALLLL